MFEDFFIRAMLGAIGIAIAAAPLGCVVVWQRMAYFGETLAHSSLLGIAFAFAWHISLTLAVFAVALSVALILLLLQKKPLLSNDSLLGILSHSSLACGLVALSFLPQIRGDLSAYLFGDILSVTRIDIMLIWGGAILAALLLLRLWRPLIAATVSADLAEAENLHPARARAIFMLLLALIIAIAMKIIGILLIGALLVLPAAAARNFADTPEKMVIIAAIIGILSSFGGLFCSYYADTPSGPSIVLAGFVLFLCSLLPFKHITSFLRRDSKKYSEN